MGAQLPGGLNYDALASYHYSIEIDGVEIAQFMEVSGIVSEVDVIQLKENTPLGKYVIKMLPGNSKPPTITLKRAKSQSTTIYQWHDQIRNGQVAGARKNGSIVLYNYDHSEVARWNFINAWPSKVTTGTLKANASEILTEEVAIVCEEIHRVK